MGVSTLLQRIAIRRPTLRDSTHLAAWGLLLAWLAGRLLGDGNWLSGLLFYVPTPLVMAALMLSLWLSRDLSWRPIQALQLLWLAMLTVRLISVESQWPRPADDHTAPLQLVHWNVFRGYMGWQPTINRLRALSADVYVLNEAPREISRGNWALTMGPGFDYALAGTDVVACRGEVTHRQVAVAEGLVTLLVDCSLSDGQGNLRILAVDMAANLTMARDPVLAVLLKMIEEHQPDLIAGDFNAPRLSTRLRRLPEGYQHAYEEAGGGWPYTWPVPLPVLAIDQCIIGPRIKASSYRLVSTPSSDHRLQILRFDLLQ